MVASQRGSGYGRRHERLREVITKSLEDEAKKDRTLELMEDVSYVNPPGIHWLTTKGRELDEAIAPALWSGTLGSPYVSNYRRNYVISGNSAARLSIATCDIGRRINGLNHTNTLPKEGLFCPGSFIAVADDVLNQSKVKKWLTTNLTKNYFISTASTAPPASMACRL